MSHEEDDSPPVDVAALTASFFEEIAERCENGDAIRRCYACGMCSAGCPVSEVDGRYSPRRFIRMVLLGMREEVLRSDFIWLCTNCHTCAERCPQGLPIPPLIRAAKNLAASEGGLPPNLGAVAAAVAKIGRLYEIEEFDNKKRTKAGLPPLATTLADVVDLLGKRGGGDE